MARPKKEDSSLTVKVAGVISDGKDGFLAVGDKFIPADDEAAAILKARGLAE